MPKHVVLLRGVNLGARNRVTMPRLREGSHRRRWPRTSESAHDASRVFGLDLEVLVRGKAQLAAIVKLDPLGKIANDPRRYQVTFLVAKPKREVVERLEALAAGKERLAAHGRELYAWHPNGVGRSKLATALSAKSLGVAATARNWATVTKLLELASA